MIEYREYAPNICISVPGWSTPCTDVLALPHRIMVDEEGYYRRPADGEFERVSAEFSDMYHAMLPKSKLTLFRGDGTAEEHETTVHDDDLLLRKLFGQAHDSALRTAFARCVLELGANPAEVIATGERVYSEYVEEQAAKMMAWTRARDQVDQRYGEFLPRYLKEKILENYRDLLTCMTLHLGHVPEVLGCIGTSREILLALRDVEAMTKRKLPRGDRLPRYLSKLGHKYYFTVYGLMEFCMGDLRVWYFENEEDKPISELHSRLISLQYELINSTSEGHRALHDMLTRLFGGQSAGDQ
ncbi:MAG: hypothetical protein ACM3RP_07140 [Chitinophagales bacterium]